MNKRQEELAYLDSYVASRERRRQDQSERRLDRWLLLVAAIGVAVLIWYVGQPYPSETWYVGLGGILLVLPYLTRRFD